MFLAKRLSIGYPLKSENCSIWLGETEMVKRINEIRVTLGIGGDELIGAGVELDLYWNPKTLKIIRGVGD